MTVLPSPEYHSTSSPLPNPSTSTAPTPSSPLPLPPITTTPTHNSTTNAINTHCAPCSAASSPPLSAASSSYFNNGVVGGPASAASYTVAAMAMAGYRSLTPTRQLAENAVEVRRYARDIGRVMVKLERPKSVMIVAKAFEPKIIEFTRQLACHLIDTPRNLGECLPCNHGLTVYIDEKLKNHPSFCYSKLIAQRPHYKDSIKWWNPRVCADSHDKIDFIVTLGGDGTVLYTSWLFQHSAVPPVIPFHLGSLGFLTNFDVGNIKNVLARVIGCQGDGVRVNMRMRLTCTVWRYNVRGRGGDNIQLRTYQAHQQQQQLVQNQQHSHQESSWNGGERARERERDRLRALEEQESSQWLSRGAGNVDAGMPRSPEPGAMGGLHLHAEDDDERSGSTFGRLKKTHLTSSSPSLLGGLGYYRSSSAAPADWVNARETLERGRTNSIASGVAGAGLPNNFGGGGGGGGAGTGAPNAPRKHQQAPTNPLTKRTSEVLLADGDDHDGGNGDDAPQGHHMNLLSPPPTAGVPNDIFSQVTPDAQPTPTINPTRPAHSTRRPSYTPSSPLSSAYPSPTPRSPSSLQPPPKPVPTETFQILNDLVVDRGPSAYMGQLELFVDDRHLTTVQADGLVIGTPTGSTAYSLSAGGSLLHPEIPAICVSPICPHTLSFRPMLLPDSVELKIQVPADSRSTAWASFDGRHRIELKQGDYVTVTLSRWPMPTVCLEDQSIDWFNSLRRCLHWNERTRQAGFGSTGTFLEALAQKMFGGDEFTNQTHNNNNNKANQSYTNADNGNEGIGKAGGAGVDSGLPRHQEPRDGSVVPTLTLTKELGLTQMEVPFNRGSTDSRGIVETEPPHNAVPEMTTTTAATAPVTTTIGSSIGSSIPSTSTTSSATITHSNTSTSISTTTLPSHVPPTRRQETGIESMTAADVSSAIMASSTGGVGVAVRLAVSGERTFGDDGGGGGGPVMPTRGTGRPPPAVLHAPSRLTEGRSVDEGGGGGEDAGGLGIRMWDSGDGGGGGGHGAGECGPMAMRSASLTGST
ncbi:hypothetical protein HK102_014196, partial [Quaeritorhiza haematococci]